MKESNLNECASVSGASNQAPNSPNSPSSSNSANPGNVTYEETDEYNNQTNTVKTPHPKAHLKQSAQNLITLNIQLPTFMQVEKVTLFKGAKGELFNTEKEAQCSILELQAFNKVQAFVEDCSKEFFFMQGEEDDIAEFCIKRAKSLAPLLQYAADIQDAIETLSNKKETF